MPARSAKPRLRLTSQGWYRHWCDMLTGTVVFGTGRVLPDQYGQFERALWVGPFASAEEAFRLAL